MIKTRLLQFAVLLIASLTIGLHGCDNNASKVDTDGLQSLLNQMVDPSLESVESLYGPAPGAVLQLDGPDLHFQAAAGLADVENQVPVQVDDRFEVGSSTKMFTAVIFVQLAEEGALSLNDPLARWLPGLAENIPYGDRMTLLQLANHTAGIRDYGDAILDAGQKDDKLMRQSFTPEELVQLAMDNGEPDFVPGARGKWQYSNTGYILLGMVLEKVSGKTFAELLRERILTPLKMTATSFPDNVPSDERLVQGYVSYPGGKNTTQWNLSQAWAAGGLISSAADMTVFLHALANGRLFQDPSTLLVMADFVESKAVADSIGARGYGVGLIKYTDGVWGHAGQTSGFESEMMFVPGTDISMVALTNSAHGPILQMRSLAPVLQNIAGIEPQAVSEFPRPEPDYNAKRSLDFKPMVQAMNTLSTGRILELDKLLLPATVAEIQDLLESKKTTSEELALYYLARIQAYDWNLLNSVIELNPQVLETARRLDRERAAGKARGPMQGIPVLLKDNIAAKGMHATAGAWAMREWLPERDAELVRNLRSAGALILGKANLSEWANYMDPGMPSGFSDLGGQTRNPYGPYEVLGSSSGSAVAAAAGFAAVTVGTETKGSIILPAAINGVVAIKTSRGLVSGDYIIPLVDWMDVPGPMGRTVTDVAVLLTAMVGAEDSSGNPVDYSRYLSSDSGQAMRIGFVVLDEKTAAREALEWGAPKEQQEQIKQLLLQRNGELRQLVTHFSGSGISLVEIDAAEMPPHTDANAVLPYGFRDSLNRFLGSLGSAAPVDSLAGVIALNEKDLPNRAPYGQKYLVGAQNSTMTRQEYDALVSRNKTTTAEALGKIFEKHGIKALISNSQAYAPAGFPAITVPAGYKENGEPYGVIMIGNYMGEADIIRAAYIFEQFTKARKAPDLDMTIRQVKELTE